MAKIRFGGPSLPEHSHTNYDHINADGTIRRYVRIDPGAVIDEARVTDAQSYIDRGMATRIADDAAVAARKGE